MYGGVSFGRTVRSLASGGLGVILLVGGAGCLGENGEAGSEDDVTSVTSAFTATFRGHTYIFSDNAVNWSNAQVSCAQQGMHLASIHDIDENAFVFQTEQNLGGGSWWLGYTDRISEGSWAWADGMGQGFVNWQGGEPNNATDEDCLMHLSAWGGKWNDDQCGKAYRFVCESGGVETPLAPFWLQVSNTNSDTVNYVQFAVDLTFNHLATIGTCSSNTGDTYLRLMRPNGTQLVENDDACGPSGLQSQLSVSVPQSGTYVIRGGCYANSSCGGVVSVVK